MDSGLQNKRVIVTGAATGIGRATALALLEDGARVALWDRNAQALAATLNAAAQYGTAAVAIEVDVSNAQSVAAAFARTLDQLGGLEGAFNNAGIGVPTLPIEALDEADYDAVLGVNLKGVWLCMREQIRHFKANGGGAIVNNASVAGLVALAMQGAYGAAKHGVIGLTKVAAVEGAAANIRVNAICPGAVQTPILSHLEQAGIDHSALAAMSPQNRIAEPREIAAAVRFLLSDSSSFVTGAAIPVDGGWTAQ
jgi:NAD(P)-dependent dehydrogenase (short-subunit alcohol dehydrogenase family)